MKTIVEIIDNKAEESAYFKVCEMSEKLEHVITILKEEEHFLMGEENGALYKIPFCQLLYIEVVDKKSFLYTAEQVCYSAEKLYQLEERLRPHNFIRVGKSQLLNIEAIRSVSPTLSGRFEATLTNGELIPVSRKYVPDLKRGLGMESRR